jgi:hypothetical protein
MNWKACRRERVQRNLRQTDHKDFRHDIVERDLNPERKHCSSNTNLRPRSTLYRDFVGGG